jgi:dienelactone hydrolase
MIDSNTARHRAAGLALACAASAAAAADLPAPASVPTADFFSPSSMRQVRLSPDGQSLSVLVLNRSGHRQLAVIETSNLQKATAIASFEDRDIVYADWVDGKRLVFALGDERESAFASRRTGIYAVDRDGSDQRILVDMRARAWETGTMIKSRALSPVDYYFGRTLDDGSGDVIVHHMTHNMPLGQLRYEVSGTVPLRLNTRTGVLRDVVPTPPPGDADDWTIDEQGRARAATTLHGDTTTVYTPDATGRWIERATFPAYGSGADRYSVDAVGADGQLYGSRSASDEHGSRALYRIDPATGRPESEPLVQARGFDVALGSGSELVQDFHRHRVLGIHYESDAAGTAWFDPEMKALQAKVDARLPGLVNRIDVATCGCAKRVLVTSSSDRQPPLYFLYDREDDSLMAVGRARPAIDPRQMADTDFVRIKARDGESVPVYVTKPHGKGPWPAVVLVHGGPWVRGEHWEWSAESQFLASRGYLVVRPEFRGSTGYGDRLFAAGFKQWGLKMQDDIADATRWAASQGLADPARTCIAGASYGGYATLMGLVRYPELYRCGVAWAAVTDINLMYDINWSDMSEQWKGFGMPVLIGDQGKDAAQLAATSPLMQAARIQRPLLLAHGAVDQRVPIDHALKMRSALEAAHAPLEWVEYKDEAHGWYKPETRIAFYDRMAAFLAAKLGSAGDGSAAQSGAAVAATAQVPVADGANR